MAGVQGPVPPPDYVAFALQPDNTLNAVAQHPDYPPVQ
jgi:hypothetical protein